MDVKALFWGKIRKYKLIGHTAISSIVLKFLLWAKGISAGRNIRAIGVPYFYRESGSHIQIGDNCTFRSDRYSNLIGVNHKCILSTHSQNAVLEIGNNCGFSGVIIGAKEKIIIGNDLMCGANVLITDFDWHNVDPGKRNITCETSGPVVIADNVFIGINSMIFKGVTIGKNSVIGAGSVVTKSIPPNVIAAGNPCKPIKTLPLNVQSESPSVVA